MARNALAAVSIALLSLGAATAAQAQINGTVVIQSGQPQQYYPATPMVVQYGPRPHPATKSFLHHAAAWSGSQATGNGAATATFGCRATG